MSTLNQIELEIPGSFTLDEILNGLIEVEELRNRNLTALAMLPDGPDGEHLNSATLVKQPVGVPFPVLLLVAVPAGGVPPPPGKKHLFDATIWVENKQTKVAAFR
jgi:hypothetical protein